MACVTVKTKEAPAPLPWLVLAIPIGLIALSDKSSHSIRMGDTHSKWNELFKKKR